MANLDYKVFEVCRVAVAPARKKQRLLAYTEKSDSVFVYGVNHYCCTFCSLKNYFGIEICFRSFRIKFRVVCDSLL